MSSVNKRKECVRVLVYFIALQSVIFRIRINTVKPWTSFMFCTNYETCLPTAFYCNLTVIFFFQTEINFCSKLLNNYSQLF